jgi:hypothetical protein
MIGQFEIRTQRQSQKVIIFDCLGKNNAVVDSMIKFDVSKNTKYKHQITNKSQIPTSNDQNLTWQKCTSLLGATKAGPSGPGYFTGKEVNPYAI